MFAITPYQLLVPFVSLVLITYAWNLVMKQKKTIWEASLWTVFWGAIAVVALFPNTLQYLSVFTGVKNNENAAVFTALGILFFGVFYIIIRVEEMEQRMVKIVRDEALREAGLSEKRRKE